MKRMKAKKFWKLKKVEKKINKLERDVIEFGKLLDAAMKQAYGIL